MVEKVHTVLGEVDAEAIGFTQCHEHIMLSRGRSYEINPALCIDEPKKSRSELAKYKAAGGGTLVDAQPVGCNRVSEELAKISRATGVSIIASTGFHKKQFYDKGHWLFSKNTEELKDIFVSELVEGMYIDTDDEFKPERRAPRAGIIKTALDSCDLCEPYIRLFSAAVQAHKETGAPMMIHVEKGSSPQKLARFLTEKGAMAEKIYFCHMDRTCENKRSLLEILDRGFYLEFDTIGRFKYHSDEKELELIAYVLEHGGEDRLLFGLDTTRERLKAYNPEGVGLDYILEVFIPKMRDYGIGEDQIRRIATDNPAKILSWKQ